MHHLRIRRRSCRVQNSTYTTTQAGSARSRRGDARQHPWSPCAQHRQETRSPLLRLLRLCGLYQQPDLVRQRLVSARRHIPRPQLHTGDQLIRQRQPARRYHPPRSHVIAGITTNIIRIVHEFIRSAANDTLTCTANIVTALIMDGEIEA